MRATDHARKQAESRGIPVRDVLGIATERGADDYPTGDVAVFVGTTDEGWRGASNGDEVWAIIRGGTLVTVMYRRNDQPATPDALRVGVVIR